MRLTTIAFGACVALGLAGCAALPSSGPTTEAIVKATDDNNPQTPAPYTVIGLNESAIAILRTRVEPSLSGQIGARPGGVGGGSARAVGVGDTLALTIWEGGDGGLFSPTTAGSLTTGSRATTLQNAVVDQKGEITIPYIGRARVAGLTPYAAERMIEAKLADKTVQPQVVVNVVGNVSNTVNVMGDVGAGGRIALTQRNDRLLDVLAAAGGARSPVYDETVQITRGSRVARAQLSRIMSDPRENIVAMPGDTILIQREPLAFVLLGAAEKVAQIPFEAEHLTLAEALGRVGGPIDQRADAAAVFIFRPREDPKIVERFTGQRPAAPAPIVYRLDLKTGPGVVYAQSFEVRNKDLLYVANSNSYELGKFFAFIRGGTGIVYDLSRIGTPYY
ncbi:polysaccharide biosynthesis/export family protein [Methylocella sp.]|uniref:polysaccharide biosynthesis/export family protein n=1 Tax=Methylocella sp. TaxID=1978226 RepID=UPI0035B43D1F